MDSKEYDILRRIARDELENDRRRRQVSRIKFGMRMRKGIPVVFGIIAVLAITVAAAYFATASVGWPF